MIRPPFGKRLAPPRDDGIEFVLVPRGAAASAHEWSMAEALHIFVYAAKDRALFDLDELPADAVAVVRAYEFANDLANFTIGGWFTSTTGERPADEVISGLKLIGATEVAALLQEATKIWQSDPAESPYRRAEAMARLEPSREQVAPLVSQCSEWVRASPLTKILGDGLLDTVWKEVMKQLFRCNPEYPRRRAAVDEQRLRLGLKPVGLSPASPCTVDALIAEMERAHG